MYNILFQHTCETYWCSENVSRVTPCTILCSNIYVRHTDILKLYHISIQCTIFCFNIHVRHTDVLKMYQVSLHVKILFQYTCGTYWCTETLSSVTPCTLFCFNIHVRHIEVLKLFYVSLHVQQTVSVYM